MTTYSGVTWIIRASGGSVGAGSLMLQWGAPCNDATTPSQDFAVYQGALGDYASYNSLACTTGRSTNYLAVGAPDASEEPAAPGAGWSEQQRDALEVMMALGERRADALRWIERATQLHPGPHGPDEWVRLAYRIRSSEG